MSREIKILDENYMIVDFNTLREIAEISLELLGAESSQEIRAELGMMSVKIAMFETKYNLKPIREFLISTNSVTAQFLLNNERRNIKGVDAYISYENVVAAYIHEIKANNSKVANKIEPLLKNNIFGFISDFKEEYDYETLEYIKVNGDLEAIIENRPSIRIVNPTPNMYSGNYDEYVLYENQETTIKTLKKNNK